MKLNKSTVAAVVFGTVLLVAAPAFAAADTDTVTSSTAFATTMKDTVVAVITAVVPMALTILLARKALPWARRILGI